MKKLLILLFASLALLQANALTVYVNYPSDVTGHYLWAWNNSGNLNGNNYPGNALTQSVVVNGLTWYKFTTDATEVNCLITDNYANKSADITNITSDCFIKITGTDGNLDGKNKWVYDRGILLNSTNFPDAAFRAAVSAKTGVAENNALDAVLMAQTDWSEGFANKGIQNVTGIGYFPNLTDLVLDDNDLDFLYLAYNTSLKKLSICNNDRIKGFSANSTAQAGTHVINLSTSPVTALEEFDASDCAEFAWFSAINSAFGVTSLTKLSLKNCPKLAGWSPGVAKQTNLVYLDMTNNALTGGLGTGINASGAISTLTKLETLILANNSSLTCANVSTMSNLKYLDMSGTDIYFNSRQKTYMTPANNPNLETFIADNANWSSAGDIDGFQNLKTVEIAGNGFSAQVINNCPAIETVDVSNNTKITALNITNSALTAIPAINGEGCTALKTMSLDGNQFAEVPATGVATVKYLSMQNNAFPATYVLDGETSLEGLDLGNNAFTSLTVENSNMSALSLTGNDNLTALHLHGNGNLKKTASETGINAAQGLYIKGMSNLKVLDIENSSFEELGQSNSTQGCTGITHLKASHNNFTTFSNAYTSFTSGARTAVATRSSLEHLTGLTHLDLSYNQLSDSLHLFKNTALDTLIVCHNRTIDRYDDLNSYLAGTQVRNGLGTNGGVGKGMPDTRDLGVYNDTTGLRMLNFKYNKNLKYLDISYTSIQSTAAGESYMANFSTKLNETPANLEPHFFYILPCNGSIEEIYADYNGMMTFGYTVGFNKLRRISQIETRGQHHNIMQGSLNPNRSGGIPNLEYLNLANSDLDSIGVSNCKKLRYLNVSGNWTKNNWSYWSSKGNGYTLNLKGNEALVECVADNTPYLKIVQANDRTNLSSLSLNQDPANTQLMQVYVPNTGLARIDNEAYGKPESTKKLPSCEEPYIEETSGLGLAGLGTATNLQLLYCEDNSNLTTLDLSQNTALQYLHAYNNNYGADGLNLTGNTAIKTAWVSNSGLTSITVNGCAALDTLKCQDNPEIAELNVASNTAMRYLDLARNHVRDLDLSANTGLVYLDCSNDTKCTATAGNWISDLNFTSTALQTVIANNNDLYNISFPQAGTQLACLEYEHNHVNGIDLSGATATLTAANIKDADNGRAITAECTHGHNGVGNIYYLQLDENAGDKGGTFLSLKPSVNELKNNERTSLADDNFDATKVNAWAASGVSGIVTGSLKAIGADDITADMVYGKIAVLVPTQEGTSSASGRAEYTYDNGISTSTYYLDWTSSGIVTAIDDINADSQVQSVTYYDLTGKASTTPHDGVNIVVTTHNDGTTTTQKLIK